MYSDLVFCFANVNSTIGWKTRCSEFFPYSTYFEGSHSSAIPNSVNNQIFKDAERIGASRSEGSRNANSVSDNGKLEGFKDLSI